MDPRRLRAGEWITALGGALLLVALFLPWYSGASGWESLTVIDVVLALIALAALGLVPLTAAQPVPALPLAADALLALAGKVALVLVIIRISSLPEGVDGRGAGIWLALAASAVVIAGGWIAMRDERLSSPGETVDLSGRPVTAHPEVETVPAPRP